MTTRKVNTVTTGRGGKRPGAGRPCLPGRPLIAKTLRLPEKYWKLAGEIGEGNMTRGIRRALDAYNNHHEQRKSK